MSLGTFHGILGSLVLLVSGIRLYLAARGTSDGGGFRALTGISHLLLLALVGMGWDMWLRGSRPSGGGLDTLHLAAGTGAFLVAVLGPFALRRRHPGAQRGLALVTLLLVLVAWLIGYFA